MKANKKMILKRRNVLVFGGLLLSLVLIVTIMAAYFLDSYQDARDDVLELSKNSSERNAENIEMFFLRHEDVLLTAAQSLEYALEHESSACDVEKLLRSISEAYNDEIYENATGKKFTGIYASVKGTLIHGMHASSELEEGYNPLVRPWYKEGLAGGGKVVFGEPYWDTYDKDTMVMTATKLLRDQETVIGMDITMADLQAMIGNMDISVVVNGENHTYGYGFVITENGIVMAHSADRTEQWKDYSKPDSLMYEVFRQVRDNAGSGMHFHEIRVEDTEHGLFSKRLSNGWYAVTLTDLQDIRTSISDFTLDIILVTAIMTMVGVLYCLLITRAYLRSEKLTESLKQALALVKKDVLTGLYNRTAYDMKVGELQEKLQSKKDSSFALLMIDLNDLKYINDHYGHTEGDRYICNCCTMLGSIFPCDIYRIGGDEFAIFLTGKMFEQWEFLYDLIKQAVANANLSLTPNADEPSIAVGLAVHIKGSDETIDDLLRRADAEMYTNKLAIKQIRLEQSEKGYIPDIKSLVSDKQALASELQKGLKEEQFEVWFQPQINHVNNGTLVGAEALVRWKHPERGLISPTIFIPIFEYNGLIYELDQYVWRHVCDRIRAWQEEGMTPLPISVNVSRLDLLQADFVETVTSILDEREIPHELLHLEITESAFSDVEGKVSETVNRLIAQGFIIAIDDFGSGYSSLSLLRSVRAHIVKLDLRFFSDENDRTRNECIVESIVRMVKMLGMAVIAEGVEQMEQAEMLRILGCAYIQGNLYSEPLPTEKFTAYFKSAISEKLYSAGEKNRTEAGEEYIQSREMLHDIISGTNDVIIVADNQTKQLLYANRAAELYFGKRFDPMHPTTCIEYCKKGELCEHCPAEDLKPDERREFVTSENGAYLKLLFMQMNWNGHNAHVYYQTDITVQKQLEMQKSG